VSYVTFKIHFRTDDYDMADKRTTDIISDISEMAELSTSITASLSRKRFHGERSLLVESKRRRRIENSPVPDGDDYSIASHFPGSASTITVTSDFEVSVALQTPRNNHQVERTPIPPLQGEPTVRGWKMTGSPSLTPKTRLGQHRGTHILTLSYFYFLKVQNCY
jgi:hypothetical protein